MGKFTDKDLQNYQKENEGDADSSGKIAETEHQAKDDAMAGGELPERQEAKINEGYDKLVSDADKGSNSNK